MKTEATNPTKLATFLKKHHAAGQAARAAGAAPAVDLVDLLDQVGLLVQVGQVDL